MRKFLRKLFAPKKPKQIFVIALKMPRQKLYFSSFKDNKPNFCSLRAAAWYFDSVNEAIDVTRQIMVSNGYLKIESFTRI